MNNQIPVESLLYSNYIKYDKLSELVENNFQGSNANSAFVLALDTAISYSIYFLIALFSNH